MPVSESPSKPLSTLKFSSHDDATPLVSFQATATGPRCPFGNPKVELTCYPGGCIWLSGNSGAGKTTLSTFLAGLSTEKDLAKLDIQCTRCEWDHSIVASERCGVLFQQTTLLDALTVAGNVSVALQNCPAGKKYEGESQTLRIKQIMEAVGLDYARDAGKRPTQLSGGMARRASLALQLAQKKRIVVLDEPFAGLDLEAAQSVAKELLHLRQEIGTSLILISHEPEIAKLVLAEDKTKHNSIVKLTPPTRVSDETTAPSKNILFGITLKDRFLEKLYDYVLYSFPLILTTFIACGLAISMLSADILQRIDVTDQVLSIVDQEIRPLIKMVTGEAEANPMYLMVAKMKVRAMLNTAVPAAKAQLYAIGMAKLFVLEIGPLLTALLLCGRIGGSYAGKVATMQATSQVKLLQTLGIHPVAWTYAPALAAALLASPLLTVIGTYIALWLGGWVGPQYGIGTHETYWEQVEQSVFPDFLPPTEDWFGTLVEITTYPPIFHLWKSVTFITIVMAVAEVMARWQPQLSPRGVPGVITSSVVLASLLIIIADWGFSQWLIMRL